MSSRLERACTNIYSVSLESVSHLSTSSNGMPNLGCASGQAQARILPWHPKYAILLQKQWLLWLKLDNLSVLRGYPL